MIRAIIIDDEQHCINWLKELVKTSTTCIDVVASYTSVDTALKELQHLDIDVVFLDILFEEKTGFDFLKDLANNQMEVIFTTAHAQFAITALKLSAIDYLLKPIDKEDFAAAVKKLQDRMSKKEIAQKLEVLFNNLQKQDVHKKISLPTADGYTFVEVQNIIHCQADINYTHLFLQGNQKLTVSKSLKYFEELLSNCNFFRIHNSHLINLSYVRKYTKGKGGYVTMADNSQLEVSTRRKESFLKYL